MTVEQPAEPASTSDLKGKPEPLLEALQAWADDIEGIPQNPADARLLKALWRHDGDRLEPCPECDGECGEPCAPCTVEEACASLDRWIDNFERERRP